MKARTEDIIGAVSLCTLFVMILALITCVIAGYIKMALACFVLTALSGILFIGFTTEYEVVEYYYYDEEELD